MDNCKVNEQQIKSLEKRVKTRRPKRNGQSTSLWIRQIFECVHQRDEEYIKRVKNLVDNFKETIIKTENAHEKDIEFLKDELSKVNKKSKVLIPKLKKKQPLLMQKNIENLQNMSQLPLLVVLYRSYLHI